MSNPLAIGAISAVLRNLLDNGIVDVGIPIGSVDVTAVAPDTIDLDDTAAAPSLNLFMYRTSRNVGWENAALPSRGPGGNRISNPPLALDLHYLVTAYGRNDFEAEILLGYAMHLLHEHAVLDRPAIRRALDPSPISTSILPPAFQALTASDLADQVESVTITQEPMDSEELSRLWSAIQSHYRPSAAYLVTVVLIEAPRPSVNGLPVLTRSVTVTPGLVPPFPTIERLVPPDRNPAAVLGDEVRVTGHHLDGTGVSVRFEHRLLPEPNVLAVGTNTDKAAVVVTIPSDQAAEVAWPAGVYTVTVELVRPGEVNPRRSNVGALLLAPEPALPPSAITRDAANGNVSVTLAVRPELRPEQAAALSLGTDSAPAEPHPSATGSVDFELGRVPAGAQWLRLEVDGVESLLLDRTVSPPEFDPSRSVVVPT